MAKKMQRLDESPDFRPFKFRIQAFTNAFLEEVGRVAATERSVTNYALFTARQTEPVRRQNTYEKGPELPVESTLHLAV